MSAEADPCTCEHDSDEPWTCERPDGCPQGFEAPVTTDRTPWRSWTKEQWLDYRRHTEAFLARDPGWKAGPELLALCDHRLAKLETK